VNTSASPVTGTRTTLGRTVFAPAWVALALVSLPFLLGLSMPLWVQYVPFLASVLVLGLPHGAVDHLATARVGRRDGRGRRGGRSGRNDGLDRPFVAVGILYLLTGGAYLLAWLLAPAASFALFIALTWFHWGQGDLYVLAALPERTHLCSPAQRVLCLLVRGGLPMVVPLLAFPGVYREVARTVTGLFDPSAIALLDPVFALGTRLALGAGLTVLSLAALALGYRRADEAARRRAWRLDAAETLLLWAFFLTVPPILAVGLYFCLWHSLRHVVRVIALEEGRTPAVGRSVLGGFARFAREATPLTAGALVVFAGLYFLAPVADVPGLIALYLVLLAILTLPHVLVVTWMDRQQGIW
jgi:Brp/Blh family beta-carotene 15,15'-monooxygenase